MKYSVNIHNDLIIENDSNYTIFMMNKYNNWIKEEFDRYGNRIHYDDDAGRKLNYWLVS